MRPLADPSNPPVTPTFPHFSLKTNALPQATPFSPFYNNTDMKLSSPQPPPRPNQKIPNEAIFPPNSYQIQPLTESHHEPKPNPPAPPQSAPITFLYNESCQ